MTQHKITHTFFLIPLCTLITTFINAAQPKPKIQPSFDCYQNFDQKNMTVTKVGDPTDMPIKCARSKTDRRMIVVGKQRFWKCNDGKYAPAFNNSIYINDQEKELQDKYDLINEQYIVHKGIPHIISTSEDDTICKVGGLIYGKF